MKWLPESDLEAIKRMAIAFLNIDVQKTELSPMVVQHPIFENGIQYIQEGDKPVFINILEDKEQYAKLVKKFEKHFNAQTSVMSIFGIIRKSYRLTFLKHIKKYLSLHDFSELLTVAWTISENPNQDVNVPLKTAISWFKQADKTVMMQEDEYEYFQNLPEQFTVYRGVSVGRNPKGLSWTCNLETAKWFAHRFDDGSKKGYVQCATIDKEYALAYFNGRDEDEIVVDSYKIKDKIFRI